MPRLFSALGLDAALQWGNVRVLATSGGDYTTYAAALADIANWTTLLVMPGTYVLRAEINHARDWNETYRADASEVDSGWSGGDAVGSGQPSLVWQGTIQIGGAASEAALKPFGHGHPSGATGDVIPDLKTLTTAMHILEAVQVKYVP